MFVGMVAQVEHVSDEQRSSALGMRLASNRGVHLLTPIALGLLSEVFGCHWAFFMVGTVLLGVIYVVYRLTPFFDQTEAYNKAKSIAE